MKIDINGFTLIVWVNILSVGVIYALAKLHIPYFFLTMAISFQIPIVTAVGIVGNSYIVKYKKKCQGFNLEKDEKKKSRMPLINNKLEYPIGNTKKTIDNNQSSKVIEQEQSQ